MTSPLAAQEARAIAGARKSGPRVRVRRPSAPRRGARVLALGWVTRALRRQAFVFLLVAAAVSALGMLYQTAGGASLLDAAPSSIGVGLAAALIGAMVREAGRNTVTSLSSLGKHRGYAVLGAAPALTPRSLRELPPDQRTALGCLAHAPASLFATAFRDLQGALTNGKVVAVIGSLPGEGATTVALCTAASAAQQGRTAIIVDCDLRRRSLTRGFGLDPDVGVLEATERPEYWREYVEQEDETGVHFLPAARLPSPWKSLIGARGFPGLIRRLRDEYDLVLLDCPPALASADGAVIARMADRCVIVTAWDRTRLDVLRTTVRALRVREAGIYVNRVPPGYRFGRLRPD